MKMVNVVKVGKSYHPWTKRKITFEGTEEECLQWIKENLKEGQHAYIEQVLKVEANDRNC